MSMSKYTQWTCEYIKYCHHTSWALLWVEKHDGITTHTKKERRQQGRNAKARHDISTFFLQYWDASSLSFLNCHLLSCLESSLESNDKKLYFSCILNVREASYFDWIFTLLLRQIFTFFDQSMPQFFT